MAGDHGQYGVLGYLAFNGEYVLVATLTALVAFSLIGTAGRVD